MPRTIQVLDEPMSSLRRCAVYVLESDAACGFPHPFREHLLCGLHVGHGGPHALGDDEWAASSVYVFGGAS